MFEWRWPAFFTRVTAGLLFGMAGVHKVFIVTPEVHARKLFLEPYQHTWIPYFLLWLLGVGIPFLELIAGWLLVAGYLRRPVAIVLGFLLLTVTYGRALLEPLFNVTSHIFPGSFCFCLRRLLTQLTIRGPLTEYWRGASG